MKNLLLGLLVIFSINATAQENFNWKKIADYPYKAWGMNACSDNQYLYTFSNCGGANNTLYRYSPSADKWDTLAKLNANPICNTAMSVIGKTIYLIGNGNLYKYNIITDTWDVNTITLPAGFTQNGVTQVTIANVIYYIGGGTPTSKNLYKFDSNNNTFTKLSDMNTERENAQAAFAHNTLFVFGGRKNGSALNTIEEYDVATNKWTTLAATIDPRYFGYAFYGKGHIYIIGGERGVNNYKYKSIDIYNTQTKAVTTHTSANDMNVEHTAFGMAQVGNDLVAAGGYTNTPSNATTDYCESSPISWWLNIAENTVANLSYTLYPNPASKTINIVLTHPENINTISIYSITGQHISTNTVSTKTLNIDVSELQTGTYFIKANGAEGTHTEIVKVIH